MTIAASLVECWHARRGWCLLFLPLSLLFFLMAAWRRAWTRARRLPVPVVVVGNITVGGTGKTPLVLWLVARLRAAGFAPGVISRGYGGGAVGVRPVHEDSLAEQVGDEPLLIRRRAGCPVWVGRDRVAAGQGLLASHPEVDVIVSDDGLQHYALARDVEIAVIDGQRGFGNGWPLPAGPLREPTGRLESVDAVVVNGAATVPGLAVPARVMTLAAGRLYRLSDPGQVRAPEAFAGRRVSAVAGIGNPARFFRQLEQLGLMVDRYAFPDHHVYRADDLPAGPVLMTEKDAVKCVGFGRDDLWVLAVDAELPKELEDHILATLKARHGCQVA